MSEPAAASATHGSTRKNGRVSRGRLRIYLGAAPGVGKTYAMLGEAHRRVARGTDVVVGFVETHNRPQTAAMLTGLPVVPRRVAEHRGARFEEMDLAALLELRPEVALVDELAHTNVPGSRHIKRWQDVEALLEAGIDVVSTVNIQHLESLNDVVEAITGVRQRETVPDAVVRAADQIELVDMSPESLRRRLAHGNVYASEKVDAALANYFRIGNLTALRELALLWVADRVEEGLERYRADHGIEATWAARQRIVVALTGDAEGATLLRRGAGIAGRSAGRVLVAVHVVRGDGTVGAGPESIARLRQLTEDLSGTFHTVVGDDVATAVLEFARSVNGTQVVVGASRRSRISAALRPSTVEEIVRDSGEIDVHVVSHEKAGRGVVARRLAVRGPRRLWSWVLAVAIPVALTLVLLPFRDGLSLTTVLLAYLLGVVASSLVGGLVPAVGTALVAGGLANWYFTPPYHELTISEPENVFALFVFLVVGAIVASIVDRSAARAQEAERRRAEANVLASLSVGVLRREDGVRALLDQACETFGMTGAALVESSGRHGETDRIVEVSGSLPPTSVETAAVAVDAGPGLVLALSGHPLRASDRRVLDAFAAQAAAVLEWTGSRRGQLTPYACGRATRCAPLCSRPCRTTFAPRCRGSRRASRRSVTPSSRSRPRTSRHCSPTPRSRRTGSVPFWRTSSTSRACRPGRCAPCSATPRSTRCCTGRCAACLTPRSPTRPATRRRSSSPTPACSSGRWPTWSRTQCGSHRRDHRCGSTRGSRDLASSCASSTAGQECRTPRSRACSSRSNSSGTHTRAPVSVSASPWRAASPRPSVRRSTPRTPRAAGSRWWCRSRSPTWRAAGSTTR